MSQPSPRPLCVYYSTDGVKHRFWTNKLNFSADELRDAEIIHKAQSVMDKENRALVKIRRPHIEFMYIPGKTLICKSFYPYWAFLDKKFKVTYESIRKQGLGVNFELKVLKFLRQTCPGDTRIFHHTTQSGRIQMLEKMGISPLGTSHTLDEHIKLYEKRIKQAEAKSR